MNKLNLHSVSIKPIVYIVIIMVLAGCGGGAKTHDISTNFNGNIFGVRAEPSDGSTEVSTGDDILISWPETNFTPPASFTFKMFEESTPGDFTGVYTELKSETGGTDNRVWRFTPVSSLSSGTWHKITLTDNKGHKEVIMFRTEQSFGAVSKSENKAINSESKGAVEHFIQVR